MKTIDLHNIDVRRIKQFAAREMPKGCPLREILLMEHDVLGVEEFLFKLEIWLKLLEGWHGA